MNIKKVDKICNFVFERVLTWKGFWKDFAFKISGWKGKKVICGVGWGVFWSFGLRLRGKWVIKVLVWVFHTPFNVTFPGLTLPLTFRLFFPFPTQLCRVDPVMLHYAPFPIQAPAFDNFPNLVLVFVFLASIMPVFGISVSARSQTQKHNIFSIFG